ncbi:MAG: sporulation initiation factor Spo0A C-terminal domain-containing protein [Lachnospiraceae bacterium]|nr:sporulation initiation factor Spo0A C-terminal domain-containing protein [Lachnospiraceae bacterium]MCD8363035.1 sporulation initiation factor Spo0A C-terminal domain-containing protein [Lachnospiraceae bacterium]
MMESSTFHTQTRELLLDLGITPNYTGYFYLTDALEMISEEPQRLLQVTKRVYPEIAGRYNTSAPAVERCMRTAAEIAWKTNPELLQKLVGHQLYKRLKVGKFLAVLSLGLIS